MPFWSCMRSKAALTSASGMRWLSMLSTSSFPSIHSCTRPGHLAAALDAAERGAGDAPAGDQEARHDLERLALAGDADHRREPPRLARRLDGLAHDLDDAGGLEGVVAAEAARSARASASTTPRPGEHRVRSRRGGAPSRDAPRRGRSRRSARRRAGGSRRSRRGRRGRSRRPRRSSRPRPGPCRTRRRGRSRGRRRRCSRRPAATSGPTFASAISGITVASANVEVPMKCRSGSPPRESRVVPSGR